MKGLGFMKFKAFVAATVAAIGVFACGAFSVSADDNVSVSVDNTMVQFDQQPVIINGFTLVPIRAVFEQAGAVVTWDQPTQTATISRLDYIVTIKNGDNYLMKNGQPITLEQPAQVINDRTLIPVRAIAEAMDFAVTWDGQHKLVLISTTGKPYRAFAFLKTGFRTLEDHAEFYSNGSAMCDVDLDGNAIPESIVFQSTQDMFETDSQPVLTINGIDYTAGLGSLTSVYSMAVVDLDSSDNVKEIIITENGDTLTAHFYRYENGILKVLAKDGTASTVQYASKLLMSGTGYIISDLTGVCFTDIMVTGCMYRLDGDSVGRYRMSKLDAIFGRNLYNTYPDNMLYNIIYTKSYQPGTYEEMNDVGVINATDMQQFKVLNGYRDEQDPRYIELYIELPNGERVVITPYQT